MASSPIFVGTPNTEVQIFDNGDATNEQVVFTAGASGSRIDGIVCYTDDATVRYPIIGLARGGVTYFLQRCTLTAGPSATNLLAQMVGVGAFGLVLESGDTLTIKLEAALTAGKYAYITVIGGDF